MQTTTWPEVWAQRLARHALQARVSSTHLAEVVGRVCGIHAQMMPAAELSIGIRVAEMNRRDVAAALWEQRTLVKTYGLRGTVHLFPAAELPLWMAALRPQAAQDIRRLAKLGLEQNQLAEIVQAIGRALDGQHLTTEQLGEAVAGLVGAWAQEPTAPAFGGQWPRWRMALGSAAAAGMLCYGPNQGAAATFVRPDQWIGGWQELEPASARAEIVRRYLRAYGPATPRDIAQWLALPSADAEAIVAGLGAELAEIDIEGQRAMLLANDTVAKAKPAGDSVRLLPHFDCYLVGCHPRERLVPEGWRKRVLQRGAAGPVPVLLVDGTVAGVWTRAKRGRTVAIQVEPFVALSSTQQDMLQAEAQQIGAILETQAALELGPVQVRPHL